MNYTYTIYDAHPAQSGSCAWPGHADVALEADTAEEALDEVSDALEVEAAGLSECDGYSAGQRIYAQIELPDGTADIVSYELTEDDLS